MRAAALALLVASCRDPAPPISACTDFLGGVWRADGSDRAYHLLDRGGTKPVELFPMWDATRLPDGRKARLPSTEAIPIVSPVRLAFPRRDAAALAGTASLRVTRGGTTCRASWPIALSGCAGGRATLSTHDLADVDLETCALRREASPRLVPLRRE